jgi:hypothetical protein
MNKLKKLTQIKTFMENEGILDLDFNFACYSDQMFTYDLFLNEDEEDKDEPFHIEITFKCDPFETLLSEMSFVSLLNLRKLEYMDFCTNSGVEICYNSLEECNLN